MWRQQKVRAEWHICENASICEVYSIIFSNFCCFLFRCVCVCVCFPLWFLFSITFSRLLFNFLRFCDAHRNIKHLNSSSNGIGFSACVFDTSNSIYYYLSRFVCPPSSTQISSQQQFTHSHFPTLLVCVCLRAFCALSSIRYFRLFYIAILFDIKMWLCAVSFNMWLNVYNSYNVMMRCYISSILNTITLNQSREESQKKLFLSLHAKG